MAKSKKSAKKKVAAKKTPIVKLQMRTEKVISKSGNEYYRPVKQGKKKSKPAKKTIKTPSVKKQSSNPFSMSERFNWRKFNKQYTDLYNEIQKDEKALQKKKDALKVIGDHLISIEREFSPM